VGPDAETLLRHASGIRALLRGLLSDDAQIDDVLQDTWVAALAKGPRPGVPLGPWLRRVARNFALKLRRGDARRAARERAASRPDGTPEARFDLQRAVVDELARLGEPYRATLILRFFEGLSPKEIAERRGEPPGTVRSHLKRGLDRIRERLDRSQGGRGAWGAMFLPWLAAREAAATGVIVMSVKTKLVLAAALLLAMLGGTAGVVAWRGSSTPADAGRAATPHAAPLVAEAEQPAEAGGAPPPPAPERSLILLGRILDAATKRVVPNARLHIALAGGDRTLDLVTDDAGEFSGTSPLFSERSLDFLFQVPTMLARNLAVEVEGYAVRPVPETKAAGEDRVDLGDIEVSRGAVVAGRVVRRDRSGIAGAILLLSFQGTLFPPAYAFGAGRSGADGSFALAATVPVTDQWPWTLMAICEEGLGCRTIDVLSGRDRVEGVEILVDGAAPLEVTVTDDAGTPIPGARVSVEPWFAPLRWPLGMEHSHDLWHGRREDVNALFTRKTDAQGKTAFPRLPPPGPYDVIGWAQGFTLGWQDRVAVDLAEKRSVTLRLARARLCAVSGRVLADDGTPIAHATVGPRSRTVETDGDGNFRIEGLETDYGKAMFAASAEGFGEATRDIPLSAERDVEGVEFRLERAAPSAGRVVDDRGQPIAGVYVDLLRSNQQLRPSPQEVGPDGRFAFPKATKGAWKLRVFAPEGHPDLEQMREIDVRGGDAALEIVLRRLRLGATKLVARVVEAGTGKALDASNAFLMRRDWAARTGYAAPAPVERRSGEVSADRLHADAWRLWVKVPGYAAGYVDFEVVEGQPEARPEVRLGRAGRIVGRVVGAPAHSVWTIPAGSTLAPGQDWEADGRVRGWAQVAADGTFVIENLAPGPTVVTLGASGFLGTATAEVPSGGDAQVEITATPAAQLRFRSKDPVPEGTEIVEFQVSQGGDWRCVMRLGGEAGRRIDYSETLPAGTTRWRVQFESDGRVKTQEGRLDLVVVETAEALVPIELER